MNETAAGRASSIPAPIAAELGEETSLGDGSPRTSRHPEFAATPRNHVIDLSTAIWWVIVAVIIVFLFAPVVVMLLFSFNAASTTALPFAGFSLRWYRQAFGDPLVIAALLNSVRVALIVALFTCVAGTSAAFALSRHRSRWLDAFTAFVTAPLILPALFLGIALLSFYTQIGLKPTLWTAAIGHALVTLPFVVVIVNARLMRLDRSIEEAARDLGATAFQSFRLVVFPLIAPALLGAVLIVVAWSFDELVITFFTSGGDQTLPVRIWGMLRRGIDPSVNAMASIILLTTIACTLLAGRFISGREIAR
jgi:spermidine/putrescine transport system permease protein